MSDHTKKKPFTNGSEVFQVRREDKLVGYYSLTYKIADHSMDNYAFIQKTKVVGALRESLAYFDLVQHCRYGMINHVVGFVDSKKTARARFECPGTVTNLYLEMNQTDLNPHLDYQVVQHPVLGEVRQVVNQRMTLDRVLMSVPCYLESVLR